MDIFTTQILLYIFHIFLKFHQHSHAHYSQYFEYNPAKLN